MHYKQLKSAAMLIVAAILMNSCIKSDHTVFLTSITADSTSFKQCQVATLSGTNVVFKKSSYSGILGGQYVNIVSYGNKLAFVVPNVPAGSYSLESIIEGTQCFINIKVTALPKVTNAASIVQNALGNSIATVSYLNNLVSTTAAMQGTDHTSDSINAINIENLNTSLENGINAATATDITYLAQIITANPGVFNRFVGAGDWIDTNRLYKKTSTTIEQTADTIIANATRYISLNSYLMLATKAIAAVSGQSVITPQFAEASLANHMFDAMKSVIIAFNEPVINTGLVVSSIARKTGGDTIKFNNGQTYTFQFSGSYRNLYAMDSNSQEPLISSFFTAINELRTSWDSGRNILPKPLTGEICGFNNITTYKTKGLIIDPQYLSVSATNNLAVTASAVSGGSNFAAQFTSSQSNINQFFIFSIIYNNPGLDSLSTSFSAEVPATRSGRIVAGGNGTGSGNNQLNIPTGIWIDGSEKLYIADQNNNRIVKWDTGAATGVVIAGGKGAGSALSQLNSPQGVWLDGSGNLFVADKNNNRILAFPSGDTTGTLVAGFTHTGDSSLANPMSVFGTLTGDIFVADASNNRVMDWIAGSGPSLAAGGTGSGTGTNQLSNPEGVFIDVSGNLYIADSYNNRILEWTPGAANGVVVAGGNGAGAAMNQLNGPRSLYVDASGNMYIADKGNGRIQKWKAGSNTGVTVATGDCYGVFLDHAGNIFVLNSDNISIWNPY